jgi:hypothetical protein
MAAHLAVVWAHMALLCYEVHTIEKDDTGRTYSTLRRHAAFLVGESYSRPLARHGQRWECNIKVELKVVIKRDVAEGGEKWC